MNDNTTVQNNMENNVNPMMLTDNNNGNTYELDFSRDSIRFAEARGFEVDTVLKFPATKIPELFYYSFRKNHRHMAKNQTDALLDKMGGLTTPMLERLLQLYNKAALTHIIAVEEDMVKNASVTVEL